MTLYDTIGTTYSMTRQADPRIAAQLVSLLGLQPGSIVADIGAGTGNYTLEFVHAGLRCIVVEPSDEMMRQGKDHPELVWIKGSAESIPLHDASVSACTSILSYHHFSDRPLALREMMRVAGEGPLLFFTFCPERMGSLWLYSYFPTLLADARSFFPNIEQVVSDMETWSGRKGMVQSFPLPSDLHDCFAAGGWNQPEIYLDPVVRQGISSFARVPAAELALGLDRLTADLSSGVWDREHGELRRQDEFDGGYFFVRLG